MININKVIGIPPNSHRTSKIKDRIMENPNYKIDEIFRQRLHDAEVPPPPFVWPAVEHALRKRRRQWIVWMFAFGVVAACVGGLWLSNPWGEANPREVSAPTADNQSIEQEKTDFEHKNHDETLSVGPTSENRQIVGSKNSGIKAQPQKVSKAQPSVIDDQSFISTNTGLTTKPELIDFTLPTNKEADPLITQALQIAQVHPLSSISKQKQAASPKVFKLHTRRKKAEPKFCYDFSRHPSALLLDVYAGPSLAQSSLTSRVDDEPYLNQRLATEQRSVAMNAGVRATLMFNRNFLVRTGLHYDHVTEVFEFIDPTSVTYILRYNNGDPIPDTLGVQYGENYLKTYNRYGMLDIPLMVGVEMRRGRSGFSINAGISANVHFQKRGVIIDPITHEPARFGPIPNKPIGPNATLSQEVFRPNVGLSAIASIQWYWHLNTRLRLFVEPSFRQVLRPVSLDSHPVEQRYSILGLRLGATKIF